MWLMKHTLPVRISAAAILLLLVGWLWWLHAWNSPDRIFWDMMSNNLSTSSVTRVVTQHGQGLDVAQYTQLNFGSKPTAHALTTFQGNGGSLSTEEISDPTNDFVRYQNITLPRGSKQVDVKSVLGKWAKLDSAGALGNSLTSGLFRQSEITVLPIANLRPEARSKLLQTMYRDKLFRFDGRQVKTVQLVGRKTYRYTLSIDTAAYIRVMQQFEKLVGATTYARIDPTAYTHNNPISLTVFIDARSHNLTETVQTATQRIERYEGFGLATVTPLPKATLTTQELTQRLSNFAR